MEAQPEDLSPEDLSSPSENGKNSPASFTVFFCDTCGCLCYTLDHLNEHRLSMHPSRPQGWYRCAYCPYSSNHKTSVTIHERIHTGERPFMCNDCGKRFRMRHHLVDHSLVHSTERPHECADCGQRFTRARSLAIHRRELHPAGGGVTLHLCPRCGKGFRWKFSRDRHLVGHTGEQPHAS